MDMLLNRTNAEQAVRLSMTPVKFISVDGMIHERIHAMNQTVFST